MIAMLVMYVNVNGPRSNKVGPFEQLGVSAL